MSKYCSLRTKNKRNFFVEMKTSDFILQRRKPKLNIKKVTVNTFPFIIDWFLDVILNSISIYN
jgi:hypothetical protein